MGQRYHDVRSKELNRNNNTTYCLMGHKKATNGEPGLVAEMTTLLTSWGGTKRPQMVSQALWLKWPHHLLTDGAQRGHKWWARPCGWNDHTTYPLMGHKEATNGELGLVVEMTTPLTYWWGTKRPQMVSQALWLKWPHHLLPDRAQRGHKWWARPCGWNDHATYKLMGHKKATNGEPGLVVEMTHTTYMLMGHKEATNGEPGLVIEMTMPLTCWWGTKGPQMVSQALWLKWPHHLLPDGAQKGHKWWASLYEPNKYLNIPGDCHLWTGDWWSMQVDLTI